MNLIVPAYSTGFYNKKSDEPGFSDLNYVPYHQDLRVDYRTRNGPGQTPTAWNTITATDLGYTRGGYNKEQMLWYQTRGLFIIDNQSSAPPGTSKGDYHPNIQPPSSEFIYEMQGNTKFSSNPSGVGYQFRVYLTNTSDEVLTPTTADTNFNTNNPPYWRYSYIPDNPNNYITFGSPGPATPPRNISNGISPTGGDSGFISEPVQTYKTLIIIGANNNASPFQPPLGTPAISSSPSLPADASLNIPFNQLATYSLTVNYGFDLSGAYVRDASTTPWGEQNIVPTPTNLTPAVTLTSNGIRSNTWTTASDFTQNVSTLNNPANAGNTIIYPGFSYYLNNYFMSLSNTAGNISYTNMFINQNGKGGTGDQASPANSAIQYTRMVIKPPSRTDVSTDYTSYLTNQALFIEGGFVLQNSSSSTTFQKKTGIYTATSSSIFSNVVYFFTSGTSASDYNIELNQTRKCVNNKNNSTAGWPVETIIGKDLTNNIGSGLSRFILSSVDKSSTITTGYASAWGSTSQQFTTSFLELTVSASKDAVRSVIGIELDRLRGWYMGIDVTQAKAKGINLSNYPDIAIRNSQPIGGTNYSPYTFTLTQQIDTNTSGSASNTQVGQTSQYDLYIAEIEPPITWAPTQHPGVTITMTAEFFGLNRPTHSNIATSGFDVSGNLNDISQRWRPELTLMDGEIKYYTSASNTIQLQNANKTFTLPWSNITTPAGARRTETINETLQVAKSDLQQSSMNYSRDSAFIPQFAATGNYRNNVANTPQLQTYSYEFYFTPNVPNGTLLWWDYTMSSLSTPFNLTLSNPGSGGSGSPAPPSGGGAWMPTNSTGGTGFFSTYDHTNSLPNNQLMWANGGFRGAGTSGSNDPYIDFTTYHNQPTTGNYSTKKSLGENDTITYTPFGQYYLDNPFNPTSIKSITGTYKWINLKVVKSSATPNFLNVTVQNGSSTLTLGTDYMLLVCEKATFSATESPYSNRSGWKDAARAFDSSLSGTARNANGTGINTFQYASQASQPPANGGELNIFKNNLQGLEIYLRIGLSNSSANTITNVSVSFT